MVLPATNCKHTQIIFQGNWGLSMGRVGDGNANLHILGFSTMLCYKIIRSYSLIILKDFKFEILDILFQK